MASRLIEYRSGLDVALAAPPMVEACRQKMEHAYRYSLVIAPEQTGHYKRRMQVRYGVRGSPPRAYAQLYNDARNPQDGGYAYSVGLEFGHRWIDRRTGKPREIKRQRILGRVADALKQ